MKFWEKNEIRFECQGSGKCCLSRGSYGYVYLTLKDRRRLAQHLGLKTGQFTRNYCSRSADSYYLTNPKTQDCIFLDGKRCSVYKARPTQCRTWPFWPENLESPKAWRTEVATFCPGVGKGSVISPAKIREALERDHE